MDIVPHAGTVGRVEIGAEHFHLVALAQRRLDRDLDQVGRPGRRLTAAALRIGPGDVEIAQRAEVERMRRSRIAQHGLAHQLGHAIGIDRTLGGVLGHGRHFGHAIGCGGRTEDEVRNPAFDGAGDKRARLGGVVVVILQRIGNRFRHDDRSGKVHDRADLLFGDDPRQESSVSDVAFIKRDPIRHGKAEASRQVIDNRDRPTGV